MTKIASRQNSVNNLVFWSAYWCFFYRDGAFSVLVGMHGVLVGVFDVLAGIFFIQSSPFHVPRGKKYAGLKKVSQRRWWRCWLSSMRTWSVNPTVGPEGAICIHSLAKKSCLSQHHRLTHNWCCFLQTWIISKFGWFYEMQWQLHPTLVSPVLRFQPSSVQQD